MDAYRKPKKRKTNKSTNRANAVGAIAALAAFAASAAGDFTGTSFAVVASPQTLEKPEWKAAADALVAKHAAEARSFIVEADATNSLEQLRASRPRFVAFLMRHDEFDRGTIVALKRMMRTIDDDPYDDAIWGIVTGPDAQTAQRIASSSRPATISSVLATTGVGEHIATGRVAVVSDAYPEGEWWLKDGDGVVSRHSETGTVAHVFADLWESLDPEFLLTSSHATERNLEMPFSRGNVIVTNGGFAVTSEVRRQGVARALAAPQREKAWLAAGNCLIANHIDSHDMVMTALSFGKVNQFVGYVVPTWFGFVGWQTWRYCGSRGYPLSFAHFAACQTLLKKLDDADWKDDNERKGLLWDRDVTVLYGDPMQRVCVSTPEGAPPPRNPGDPPDVIVFPCSSSVPRLDPAKLPGGQKIFEADDFAFVY